MFSLKGLAFLLLAYLFGLINWGFCSTPLHCIWVFVVEEATRSRTILLYSPPRLPIFQRLDIFAQQHQVAVTISLVSLTPRGKWQPSCLVLSNSGSWRIFCPLFSTWQIAPGLKPSMKTVGPGGEELYKLLTFWELRMCLRWFKKALKIKCDTEPVQRILLVINKTALIIATPWSKAKMCVYVLWQYEAWLQRRQRGSQSSSARTHKTGEKNIVLLTAVPSVWWGRAPASPWEPLASSLKTVVTKIFLWREVGWTEQAREFSTLLSPMCTHAHVFSSSLLSLPYVGICQVLTVCEIMF